MGNVLTNISKDNTRFTVFENDQVLTADQLNDLFNYLDVQTRITRTRAIGVGIICGLEIGIVENSRIVVSKGAAITTDGDLLHFDNDQEFDSFEVFEDVNAKYPYFRMDNDQIVNMFLLRNSKTTGAGEVAGKELSALEQSTNTGIRDYVGVLYLEDYKNDPDVCTGTDCDNKGAEAVRELRVLLIHKNNVRLLLESIPVINKNYFALDDIAVPRVSIKTSIDTYQELNTAFNNSFTVKEEIKNKLTQAYQVCRLMLQDEFDGGDPTNGWSSLLDEHFKTAATIYAQYVYDFARDLSYAYNEMRETLFSDNMMCCPEVELFPKHVLMGLVKTASINGAIESPLVRQPLSTDVPILRAGIRLVKRLPTSIRFDIGSLIKRFHPIHIDTEYRHHFYESPILNNKEENIQQTRFCFMRINAMITNFKVLTAEQLQNVDQSLKITPGYFEDKPLGERSIPFYYSFNRNMPLHLYWNFKANTRKKESLIYSYFSNLYSTNPVTLSPLLFNILPFDFFRIEGHIGFKYPVVEAALNKLILEHNLPINIITVQVEKNIGTIPNKNWFFPHLYMYEKAQQKAFLSRLDKADNVNDDLKTLDSTIPVSEFKTAKQTVVDNNKDISDPAFNLNQFSLAVSNVITAASNVKAQTKQYTFSNAAIPHDFVNNTDIIQKTDVIANIFQNHIVKKKEGLLLGNFMKQNPGLEHAGGVLRGGTFVLVYTSADQNVVADFMLPYASIDKDVVADPPIYTPLPETRPPIIKFPLETVFEKVPFYKVDLNRTITSYVKVDELDKTVNDKVDSKISVVNAVLDQKLLVRDTMISNLGTTNKDLFDKVLSTKLTRDTFNPVGNGLAVAGKDFTERISGLRQMQDEVETLPVDSPERVAKETELLTKADELTKELNAPEITADKNNSTIVNSILSDVHASTSVIQSQTLKSQASGIAIAASTITRKFNITR